MMDYVIKTSTLNPVYRGVLFLVFINFVFKLYQYEKHESHTIYWWQGKFDAGNNRSGAVVGVVISHVKSFESISQHWQTASVGNTGFESFIANCSTTGVNVTSP